MRKRIVLATILAMTVSTAINAATIKVPEGYRVVPIADAKGLIRVDKQNPDGSWQSAVDYRIIDEKTVFKHSSGKTSTVQAVNPDHKDEIQDAIDEWRNPSAPESGETGSTPATSQFSSRMDAMKKDIDTLNDGVAMSFAMSAIPQAYKEGSTLIGTGVGTFNGSNALAVGVSHRMDHTPVTVNFKVASSGEETGAALGVGFEF